MTEFDSYGNVKLIHVNMPQRKTEINKLQEAVEKELIKPLDPDTAPRYMKYIPMWA